eukprot:scaffold25285_cov132-Cylindrotheca_fusiformis.AAC.1
MESTCAGCSDPSCSSAPLPLRLLVLMNATRRGITITRPISWLCFGIINSDQGHEQFHPYGFVAVRFFSTAPLPTEVLSPRRFD